MQETRKTAWFVATAAVLGLAAFVNSWMNQPGQTEAAGNLGKPFYPNFSSTEEARSLEVSALNAQTGELMRFGVQSDGDLWRIPTHFDYPAEAAARIAQTSASVMGLDRQALVGTGQSEFERFGVVDPLSDDIEDPETAGKRITLKDENGEPLADYIIGKEIEDTVPTREGNEFDLEDEARDFYIRRADESNTFRVSLDLDLSTRFSDWIDPDLLRINTSDVTQFSINNYKIEERGSGPFGMSQLFKDQGDQLEIKRSSPTEKWTMEGLTPIQEIVTDRVDDILGALDEMKIVGVRPKFKFEGKQLLTADLTPAEIPEFKENPEKAANAYRSLQNDLMDKGFNFGGSQEQLELVSENGEIEFGTSKGLLYRLHIGGVASGDDETIEIGSNKNQEAEGEDEADGDKESSADNADRFVYLRVTFDESLLGDRPAEPKLPEAPTKPEGYQAPTAEEKKPAPEQAGETKTETGKDESAGEEDTAKPDSDEQRDPAFVAYESALKEYESAKEEHEMNLTRFKQDNEAFDKKIEEGKALVEELNQRFGDWYYVISAANLDTIQSTRADLVKELKPAPELEENLPPPPGPDISFPDLPKGVDTFGGKGEAMDAAGGDVPKNVDGDAAGETKATAKPEAELSDEGAAADETPGEDQADPKVESSTDDSPAPELEESQAEADADSAEADADSAGQE